MPGHLGQQMGRGGIDMVGQICEECPRLSTEVSGAFCFSRRGGKGHCRHVTQHMTSALQTVLAPVIDWLTDREDANWLRPQQSQHLLAALKIATGP
ncbi:hypothetical protein F2P81_001277 [Scophthalmus maximus]|uniref:Uncharacterized protein n=1 Tax=Scophthalmus maximus TaxID=52904 RepID=A0A6A4TWV6_SCOMX|nr:hypothetical protein F2P81_001277 [Scophthalmus maximus]